MTTSLKLKIEGDSSSAKAAVESANKSLQTLENTSKQTTFALRQVPMQFTDIVVSLQAGQSPMQVFLQQGGQLKDLFGGVGNAARALGTYIFGLINPFTVMVGTVASVAAVYREAANDADALQRALIVSGGAAGTTASQMEDLIQQVGATKGQYDEAREAAELLATSGVLSGKALKTAIEGVTAATSVLNKDTADIAQIYVDIAKDPVKSLVKLNEQYNFLTFDVYEQIKALQKQGKEQAAVELAVKTFADTMQSREQQVQDTLGNWQKGWQDLKRAIDFAQESVVNFFKEDSLETKLSKAQQELANISKNGRFGFAVGSQEEIDAKNQALLKQAAIVNALSAQVSKADAAALDAAQKQAIENKKIEEAEKKDKTKPGKPKVDQDAQAASRFVETLQKQVATLDMSKIQLLQYEAAHLKLSEAQKKTVNTALENLKANEMLQASRKADLERMKDLQAWDIAQAEREQSFADASIKAQEDLSKSLEDENNRLNAALIANDRERAVAQLDIDREVIQAKIEALRQAGIETEDLEAKAAEVYEKQLQEIDKKLDNNKNSGRELGLVFKSAFEDAIIEGEKFGDVLDALAQDLLRLTLRRQITEPLVNAFDNSDFSGAFDGIGSFFSGLFGGGRAKGGPVSGGKFYEVNENSPELLTTGGRTFLMMGANDGYVTPASSGASVGANAGVTLNVNLVNAPAAPKISQSQDTSGNVTLDVIFDNAESRIAANTANSKGPLFDVLSSKFGLQPVTGG